MTPKKFVILGSVVFLLIIALVLSSSVYETNDAGWVSIKQAALSGELTVYDNPGMFTQAFGTVTKYKKAITIGFGASGEDGSADMGPVDVRFNDSGKAKIYGNARFELPSGDHTAMVTIHQQYRSFDHLVDTLLEPETAAILVLTANIFSSEDTYAGGRAEFQALAEDQLKHGKYLTDVSEIEVTDPTTKEVRKVKKVKVRLGTDGKPLRQESILAHYKINATQLIINRDFDYEEGVLAQIRTQRDAFMQTVTARAVATQATQDAITAEAKGKASVTTAEYEKLVEKKRAIVQADQEKEIAVIKAAQLLAVAQKEKETAETQAARDLAVAELQKQVAEQKKLALIAEGEGEARKKELILSADGALQQRLEAWVKVNEAYAEAFGRRPVPQVVMGAGSNGTDDKSATDLIDLLRVKAAKDLALDMTLPAAKPTTPVTPK